MESIRGQLTGSYEDFPISVVVDADEIISNVEIAVSESEGLEPVSLVFGKEGGTGTLIGTSTNPSEVTVRYKVKLNYEPAKWPMIEKSGSAQASEGGF
ncbi:hypothetical protein V7152_28285 [Neobacillus drentensis]|uniref:hypothetical protein n=1 Tax=Neobacillus drentensis TaxID=220684 RepID=UPI0030009CC3